MYCHTPQVVLAGKSKYVINGRTVPQSQVVNLFHSVSLNVNNPHFLIMQGLCIPLSVLVVCRVSVPWSSLHPLLTVATVLGTWSVP
jgi:hypothetical protein